MWQVDLHLGWKGSETEVILALMSNSAQRKRNSKLKLDNHIVKEAMICSPLPLLVKYTAKQMWTYRSFASKNNLVFMLTHFLVKTQRVHVRMHANALGNATAHMKTLPCTRTWRCAAVSSWREEPTVCLLFPREHFSTAEIPVPKPERWHN